MIKILIDRATVEQALEALEAGPDVDPIFAGETEDALRTALAEPVQEPVQEHAEQMAKLGWQYFECPACGSEGARAFPKPVQEPVAWNWMQDEAPCSPAYFGTPPDKDIAQVAAAHGKTVRMLYTAPPQRKPLTEEEIKAKAMEAFNSYWDGDDETLVNKYGHGVYLSRFIEFARAIEAAHGIKEQT